MNHTAALVSLATAVPPHQFHQQQILEAARGLMADAIRNSKRLRACSPTPASAIATASSRWNGISNGAAGRIARRPFWKARRRCSSTSRKRRWRVPISAAEDIDTVVTVCSTGIATPTLEARVAGRMGFRSRCLARAGVRPRLRGRRVRTVDRCPSRAITARQQCADGRARALHACGPPRRTEQGQYRRRQPVRRRRRCCGAARRRRRRHAGRSVRRKALARYARHHGMERRS